MLGLGFGHSQRCTLFFFVPMCQVLARQRGLCEHNFKGWKVSYALANISQTAQYNKQIQVDGAVVPTLLRRSLLVDLVEQRAITRPELWCIQGYPHPHVEGLSVDLTRLFPFEHTLSELSSSEEKVLIGNGMHIAVVGVWTMWAVCCSHKADLMK